MTRITWGDTGTRIFETGVDHCVFYPKNADGVAWNGITSIEEKASDNDLTPFYIDGTIYELYSAPANYAATIQEYTYPVEFGDVDGTSPMTTNGLYAMYQARKRFDLSYRTLIGNDTDGAASGYTIHLVYNAMATVTAPSYQTLQQTAEAALFQWDLQAVPVEIPNGRPTAHLKIVSTVTPVDVLSAVEDILYGTDALGARMPTPAELYTIFTGSTPVDDFVVTDNGDGTVTYSGSDSMVALIGDGTFTLTSPTVTDNGDGTFTASST